MIISLVSVTSYVDLECPLLWRSSLPTLERIQSIQPYYTTLVRPDIITSSKIN